MINRYSRVLTRVHRRKIVLFISPFIGTKYNHNKKMSITLIYGARQIVTVTKKNHELFLTGKDMQNIGIIQADQIGLSIMIEK